MSKIKTKVAVVILNWNGIKYLKQFLGTVISRSGFPDTEVIVADNGSEDESVKYIKENHPTSKLILLERNYGFSEGYNRALQQIDAEYFVLLNSDVEVTENWLAPIINLMEENHEIGACMPKIKSYKNKNDFEYAGACGGFIDILGYPFCRGRILDQIETDKGQYDKTTEIFWATGACMFVRADAFNKSGGLDNDFFAHMEEIDLCWRLKSMNYKIMVVPKVEIFHVGGGTLPNDNPRKIFLNYRNNLYLLYKNLPTKFVIPVIFFRMCLDFISGNIYLLQGKYAFYWSVVKSHWIFITSLHRFYLKRSTFKKHFGNSLHNEILKKSIVFQFFINKIKLFSNLKF